MQDLQGFTFSQREPDAQQTRQHILFLCCWWVNGSADYKRPPAEGGPQSLQTTMPFVIPQVGIVYKYLILQFKLFGLLKHDVVETYKNIILGFFSTLMGCFDPRVSVLTKIWFGVLSTLVLFKLTYYCLSPIVNSDAKWEGWDTLSKGEDWS